MSRRPEQGISTLARLKDVEERTAAARLSAARDQLDCERRKLTTVRRYLADYASAVAVDRTGPRTLLDRQRFRLQLERTAEAQQACVEQAEHQAERARAHWARVRSEREAMTKLVERRRDADRKRERESEQKRCDEHSLRSAARQGGGSAA